MGFLCRTTRLVVFHLFFTLPEADGLLGCFGQGPPRAVECCPKDCTNACKWFAKIVGRSGSVRGVCSNGDLMSPAQRFTAKCDCFGAAGIQFASPVEYTPNMKKPGVVKAAVYCNAEVCRAKCKQAANDGDVPVRERFGKCFKEILPAITNVFCQCTTLIDSLPPKLTRKPRSA